MPQLALTPFALVVDCVALEPPCDPLPPAVGETFTLLLPPDALPLAIGLQVIVMLPA